MNATATHDTKRSEDVRARLNVLTEMPGNGTSAWSSWSAWNQPLKTRVNGVLAPSRRRRDPDLPDAAGRLALIATKSWKSFRRRIKEFLVKALREAKQNSSWIGPQESYEQAVQDFAG